MAWLDSFSAFHTLGDQHLNPSPVEIDASPYQTEHYLKIARIYAMLDDIKANQEQIDAVYQLLNELQNPQEIKALPAVIEQPAEEEKRTEEQHEKSTPTEEKSESWDIKESLKNLMSSLQKSDPEPPVEPEIPTDEVDEFLESFESEQTMVQLTQLAELDDPTFITSEDELQEMLSYEPKEPAPRCTPRLVIEEDEPPADDEERQRQELHAALASFQKTKIA